jgi:uncharacterized membrane-anchored protein
MPHMPKCPISWQGLADEIRAEPWIYWLILALSLAGANLTSGPSDDALGRGWGFLAWVFGNALLGWHFWRKDRKYTMLFMYLAYEYYNIRGVLNNW